MHRLPSSLAICALSLTVALGGCTTAVLDGDLGIEPQLALAAQDPELPQEVYALPASAPVNDAPVVAAAAGGETVAVARQDFTPVAAYAGPTPTERLAPVSAGRAVAARSPELDALIERYAAHHQIPLALLRRVVNRESTFNPRARNGPYWGLMQILPQTARGMGYRGTPDGLLDAETNLIYAGKYLRGAYLVADGDHDLAVRYYSRGYYYDAKRRGMLEATGLGKDRRRMR